MRGEIDRSKEHKHNIPSTIIPNCEIKKYIPRFSYQEKFKKFLKIISKYSLIQNLKQFIADHFNVDHYNCQFICDPYNKTIYKYTFLIKCFPC